MQASRRMWLGAALGGAAAIGLLLAWERLRPGEAAATGIGGPISLVDAEGRRVTERDFLGKWSIFYFGFTACPDACPTALASLSLMLEALGGKAARVQPVFVSIDPERDTPAAMKAYLVAFDSRIIGLTGSPQEVAATAKTFRVYYRKTGEDPYYLMDHSTALIVMDPDFHYAGLMTGEMKPQDMATQVIALMQGES